MTGKLVERHEPGPPLWLEELMGDAPAARVAIPGSDALTASVRRRNGFTCIQVHLAGVERMDILSFQQAVSEAFRTIFEQLRLEHDHPVRFWAFVPQIHADYGHGLDRYMAFNAGRFAAYSAFFGKASFSRSVPTASAVGCGNGLLSIYCLASPSPGRPVENPRQIPAYQYSRRFGPMPPCFARATAIAREGGAPVLLVGGTASIRGEDSVHLDDVRQQVIETFRNLGAVVRCAVEGANFDGEPDDDDDLRRYLGRLQELRIYHPFVEHREAILAMTRDYLPGLGRLEIVTAQLCRPELLVEIEGVAETAR